VTIGEWLNRLALSDSSTEEDARSMQHLLRNGIRISAVETVVLPRAKVVLGVVYPEGYGPPVSIQWMAKRLMNPAT
jgi:hypothetical protein